MAYYGSWKIDDLLTFCANTHRFDTGAATDADSAPSYRVYEDETATPILTGTMALLDSTNTAGFYSEQITLSAANGFEKGKSYTVYIQATVNSVTAATHHSFQIEAEVDANVLSDKTGLSLAADQAVNVTKVDGVALGTHGSGQFPADLRAVDGTALTTHGTGAVPADVRQFGGTNGAFASGRPEVNTTHIAGASVNTNTAQVGVNVVNMGGSAGTFAGGRPEVNVTHFDGLAGTFLSGKPEVAGVATPVTVGTINSGVVTASALATDAVNEIADGVLTRDSANWEASASAKSLGTAVMKATHRTKDNNGSLEIYRSNGSTVHATQAITTDAANLPIDELGGATAS